MRANPTIAHLKREYLLPTETFVYNQIGSLRRYRPIVVCQEKTNDSLTASPVFCVENELEKGALLFAQAVYRGARLLTPGVINVIKRIIKRENVRLLHFHYLVDARFFLSVAKDLALPSIVSVYGYDISRFPKKWYGLGKQYLKPIFERLDCFLAMSEDMRKDLITIGCPPNKIRVHYYGSDTHRFACPQRNYSGNGQLKILMCGTLEIKKAQHLVLQALHQLSGEGINNFDILLVGDGPMRSKIESMVKEYGWQHRVTFAGHEPYDSPKLVEYYKQADIFALPSITTVEHDKEGIPGVIVEAMASGLPTVSTRHAGIPAAIDSGKNGFLVPENDVEALAAALKRLISDSGLRERLGRAAVQKATRELDLDSGTESLEQIYAEYIE